MAGFIYYVELHQGALTLDRVRALGIGYAFDASPMCADMHGPDGKRGTIFADTIRDGAPPVGYSNDSQTWRKIPNCPAAQVWVGHVANDPPTPSILQRPAMINGYDLDLADGHTWTVPTARRYTDDGANVGWYISLPRYLDYTESGEFTEGGVQRQYQRLWVAAEQFTEYMGGVLEEAGEGESTLDLQAHYHDAVTVLQSNYYVGASELAMLHALTSDTANEVMLRLIDWPAFQELINKKKASDGLSSDAGNSVTTETITRQLAS